MPANVPAKRVYLATSGTYDYRVQAVFTRREDAESFGLADDVEEFELHDGPLEVRTSASDPLVQGRAAEERHVQPGSPTPTTATGSGGSGTVTRAAWR